MGKAFKRTKTRMTANEASLDEGENIDIDEVKTTIVREAGSNLPTWIESLPLTGDLDTDLGLFFESLGREKIANIDELLDWFAFLWGEEEGEKTMTKMIGVSEEEAKRFWKETVNEEQEAFLDRVLASYGTEIRGRDLAVSVLTLIRSGIPSIVYRKGRQGRVEFIPVKEDIEWAKEVFVPLLLGALSFFSGVPRGTVSVEPIAFIEERATSGITVEPYSGHEFRNFTAALTSFFLPPEKESDCERVEGLLSNLSLGEDGGGEGESRDKVEEAIEASLRELSTLIAQYGSRVGRDRFLFSDYPSFPFLKGPENTEEVKRLINLLGLIVLSAAQKEGWKRKEEEAEGLWGLFSYCSPTGEMALVLPERLYQDMHRAWLELEKMCLKRRGEPLSSGKATLALSYLQAKRAMLEKVKKDTPLNHISEEQLRNRVEEAKKAMLVDAVVSPQVLREVGKERGDSAKRWEEVGRLCGLSFRTLFPQALIVALNEREEGGIFSLYERSFWIDDDEVEQEEGPVINGTDSLFSPWGFEEAWKTFKGDLRGLLSLVSEAIETQRIVNMQVASLRDYGRIGGLNREEAVYTTVAPGLWARLVKSSMREARIDGERGIERAKRGMREVRDLLSGKTEDKEEIVPALLYELGDEEKLMWSAASTRGNGAGAEAAITLGVSNMAAWKRSIDAALLSEGEQGNEDPVIFLGKALKFHLDGLKIGVPKWLKNTSMKRSVEERKAFFHKYNRDKRKPQLITVSPWGLPEISHCDSLIPWLTYLAQMDHAAVKGFAERIGEYVREGRLVDDFYLKVPGMLFRVEDWKDPFPIPTYLRGEEEGRRFADLHVSLCSKAMEREPSTTVLWRLAEAVPSLKALETALELLGVVGEETEGHRILVENLATLGIEKEERWHTATRTNEGGKKGKKDDVLEAAVRREISRLPWNKHSKNPEKTPPDTTMRYEPTDSREYWERVRQRLEVSSWKKHLVSYPQLQNLVFACPDPLSLVEALDAGGELESLGIHGGKVEQGAIVAAYAFGTLTSKTKNMTPKEKRALYASLRKAFFVDEEEEKSIGVPSGTVTSVLWWNAKILPLERWWEPTLPEKMEKKEAFRLARELCAVARAWKTWFLSKAALPDALTHKQAIIDLYANVGEATAISWWNNKRTIIEGKGLPWKLVVGNKVSDGKVAMKSRLKSLSQEGSKRPDYIAQLFLDWMRQETKRTDDISPASKTLLPNEKNGEGAITPYSVWRIVEAPWKIVSSFLSSLLAVYSEQGGLQRAKKEIRELIEAKRMEAFL
ncbi:MAG: hypothetical protein QXH08_00285 [Candidatus Hadarchaeales archaeon]